MAAPTTRVQFQATQNNGGIDLSIEIGNQAVIHLSLSRREIEDMLEAISLALDDDTNSPESE